MSEPRFLLSAAENRAARVVCPPWGKVSKVAGGSVTPFPECCGHVVEPGPRSHRTLPPRCAAPYLLPPPGAQPCPLFHFLLPKILRAADGGAGSGDRRWPRRMPPVNKYRGGLWGLLCLCPPLCPQPGTTPLPRPKKAWFDSGAGDFISSRGLERRE